MLLSVITSYNTAMYVMCKQKYIYLLSSNLLIKAVIVAALTTLPVNNNNI